MNHSLAKNALIVSAGADEKWNWVLCDFAAEKHVPEIEWVVEKVWSFEK